MNVAQKMAKEPCGAASVELAESLSYQVLGKCVHMEVSHYRVTPLENPSRRVLGEAAAHQVLVISMQYTARVVLGETPTLRIQTLGKLCYKSLRLELLLCKMS
jgi:hypothetical protein